MKFVSFQKWGGPSCCKKAGGGGLSVCLYVSLPVSLSVSLYLFLSVCLSALICATSHQQVNMQCLSHNLAKSGQDCRLH